MKFECSHCNQSLEAEADMEGESIQCPACGRSILVPMSKGSFAAALRNEVQGESGVAAGELEPEYLPGGNEPYQRPENSALAIASLALGIAGATLGFFCVGGIFSMAAITFGHLAHSRIKRNPRKLRGKSYAVAGFTAGYIGLVAILIVNFYLQQAVTEIERATDDLYRSMGMTPPAHK